MSKIQLYNPYRPPPKGASYATERMQWKGNCAIGVYAGERTFADGTTVRGVFGMTGLDIPGCEEPCPCKVTARCQYIVNGRLYPFWWLACDKPEHRRDAGVIEHLDENGFVTRVERFLPEGPPTQVTVRELTTGEPPYSPPKRIPRNKGNKARRRAEMMEAHIPVRVASGLPPKKEG